MVLLPVNPEQRKSPTPVMLVPRDILSDLPVAFSVEDIWIAAAENEKIRTRISQEVGELWQRASQKRKSEVLNGLLRDAEYVRLLIAEMLEYRARAYDLDADPMGLMSWVAPAYEIAKAFPSDFPASDRRDVEHLDAVVSTIIKQFRFLLEKRDLWKILNEAPTRKTEKTVQMLFFAVAFSYCHSYRLDVTPEAETGNGPVDFKFSTGSSPKVLVELKLSKNDITHGHDIQLPIYMKAENADRGHYVVVDVGNLGKKWQKLTESRQKGGVTSPAVWLIDATRKESASVRK